MSSETKTIELFEWIDKTTISLQNSMDETYLDSLNMTLEALFYGGLNRKVDITIQQKVAKQLQTVDIEQMDVMEIRKAIQFAVLKGMKKSTQPQHSMTPEAISLFVGYLAEKLMKKHQEVRVFDPASGTGNLLLIVMGHITQLTKAYASEIDPTLIKLSALSANLQKKQVEFFHQDSLRPLLLDPVDLVVSDLPVGYYPDDVQASNFNLKSEKGHTYAHHLFIEQSLHYTKDGGFLIFIIPDNLFDSEQSNILQPFIQKTCHIIGLLQLPETAFASKENKKSILILQKKGANTKPVNQPLLVILPSFSEPDAMENIIVKINQWFTDVGLP